MDIFDLEKELAQSKININLNEINEEENANKFLSSRKWDCLDGNKIIEIDNKVESIYKELNKEKINILISQIEQIKLEKYNNEYNPLMNQLTIGLLSSLNFMVESTFYTGQINEETKLNDLNELTPYMFKFRSILGDGDCFYRGLIFSILENIILTNNIMKMKEILILYNEKINKDNKLILEKDYLKTINQMNTSIVQEILYIIINKMETDISKAYTILLKVFLFCSDFDFAIIYFTRYLIYEYISANENKIYSKEYQVEVGCLLPDDYIIDQGNKNDYLFENYYALHLMNPKTFAEKIVLYVTPFVFNISMNVLIYDFEIKGEKSIIQEKKFLNENGDKNNFQAEINLLFRKMHYDTYYKLDYYEDYQKYFDIFINKFEDRPFIEENHFQEPKIENKIGNFSLIDNYVNILDKKTSFDNSIVFKENNTDNFNGNNNVIFDENNSNIFKENNNMFNGNNNDIFNENNNIFNENNNNTFNQNQSNSFKENNINTFDENNNSIFNENQNNIFEEKKNDIFNEDKNKIFKENNINIFNENNKYSFNENNNDVFKDNQNNNFNENDNDILNNINFIFNDNKYNHDDYQKCIECQNLYKKDENKFNLCDNCLFFNLRSIIFSLFLSFLKDKTNMINSKEKFEHLLSQEKCRIPNSENISIQEALNSTKFKLNDILLSIKKNLCLFCGKITTEGNDFFIELPCKCKICSEDCFIRYLKYIEKNFILEKSSLYFNHLNLFSCYCGFDYHTNNFLYMIKETDNRKLHEQKEVYKKYLLNLFNWRCFICKNNFETNKEFVKAGFEKQNADKNLLNEKNEFKHLICGECLIKNEAFIGKKVFCNICESPHKVINLTQVNSHNEETNTINL